MHDIRTIRDNPREFDIALIRRGFLLDELAVDLLSRVPDETEVGPPTSTPAEVLLMLDKSRRTKILLAESETAKQNVLTREAGAAKARGDEIEFQRLRAILNGNKNIIAQLTAEANVDENRLRDLLMTLPNSPLDDVPDGPDETGNVELRRWGTVQGFDFKPLEHFDIPALKLGLDFATAGKLSGSRFVVLRGAAARLHRALAQFMLDTHVAEHGLAETWTPVLVKPDAMYGTNQLPKFAEDSYATTNGWWLIPTSEVTLTNTVAGDMLDESALPIRLTAHTQCFRSEAGSAGKDTAGMLRQHQFEKVEMVTICTPDQGRAEHERMTGCAEAILQKLGLPYRVIVLCTGDMGFGAQRTHDLEVWLPGQDTYREISSVSVCGPFQARRMNARYRPAAGGKPEFVCTLNGSGLAVGRCLIAVVENGQQADGSVDLPLVLHPYLGGATRISAAGVLV
ncbi:MAG: serine--tRNA ligase [Gemmobacter sp.]